MPCRKSLQGPGNMFVCMVDESPNRILMSCLCLFFSPHFAVPTKNVCNENTCTEVGPHANACQPLSAGVTLKNLTANSVLQGHTPFPETSAQLAEAFHRYRVVVSASCFSVSFGPSTGSQLCSHSESCVSPAMLQIFPLLFFGREF